MDTFAKTYIKITSSEPGAAAEVATKRKHSKYSQIINDGYIFKAFAVETMGPWCEEAINWINNIGSNLNLKSGDSRSKHYLYQRISLAVQRGNAASIMGSLPSSIPMEEIFYL